MLSLVCVFIMFFPLSLFILMFYLKVYRNVLVNGFTSHVLFNYGASQSSVSHTLNNMVGDAL